MSFKTELYILKKSRFKRQGLSPIILLWPKAVLSPDVGLGPSSLSSSAKFCSVKYNRRIKIWRRSNYFLSPDYGRSHFFSADFRRHNFFRPRRPNSAAGVYPLRDWRPRPTNANGHHLPFAPSVPGVEDNACSVFQLDVVQGWVNWGYFSNCSFVFVELCLGLLHWCFTECQQYQGWNMASKKS